MLSIAYLYNLIYNFVVWFNTNNNDMPIKI